MIIHIGANDMNGGQGLYKEGDKASNHDFINTNYLNKYDEGYFIECIPSIFETLKKNLEYINKKYLKNYKPILELVDIETGLDKDFNIIGEKDNNSSKNDCLAASSMLKPKFILEKFKNLKVHKTLKMKTITFSDLIKKYNIKLNNKFDLTLDTQGNELQVLCGMGEYLKNVNFLETEYTDDEYNYYEDGCKFSELNKFLINNNFKLFKKDKRIHGNATYKKIN